MLRYVHSSFATILMGKRELNCLLSLCSWCIVTVVWFYLAVPWDCLHFVIVVFPDHTHYFCGHLLEKRLISWLLSVIFLVTFSYGVPGQVGYLIVSIPDLCPYFVGCCVLLIVIQILIEHILLE